MSTADMSWAFKEMLGVVVTHGKERTSLARAVGRLMENSDLSFSAALGNDTRQAIRRIFSKKEITPEDILAGHFEATVERINEAKPPCCWCQATQQSSILLTIPMPGI